jgi:hypothetical protein
MRTKRFLLVTAALSTAAAASVACGKKAADSTEVLPLPANPKGSFYDANANVTPPPSADAEAATATDAEAPKDAGAAKPPPSHDAGAIPVKPHPLPANPKGSHYDAGKSKDKYGY